MKGLKDDRSRTIDPKIKVVLLVEEPENFQSVTGVELSHAGQPYMDGFFQCLSPSGVALVR
jgi:hypothetical protein